MPIYAYRCDACGFARDVLQKMSDPVLTDCPACGESSFKRQVTAAGFQLKGNGWYVTDFRNNGNATSSQTSSSASVASTNSEAKTATDSSQTSTASAGGDSSTASSGTT